MCYPSTLLRFLSSGAALLGTLALAHLGAPLSAQDNFRGPGPGSGVSEPSVYARRTLSVPHGNDGSGLTSGAMVGTTPALATEDPAEKKGLGFPKLRFSGETSDNDPKKAAASKNQFASPLITVTSSLAIVLGLFAALVWLTRKYGARSLGTGAIPDEVMQSLGSAAIDPRTRVSMLRLGGRILVLGHTAQGIHPLSEITDPDEVRALTAACAGHARKEFASTLASIEQESVAPGFVDASRKAAAQPQHAPEPRRSPPSQLFASA